MPRLTTDFFSRAVKGFGRKYSSLLRINVAALEADKTVGDAVLPKEALCARPWFVESLSVKGLAVLGPSPLSCLLLIEFGDKLAWRGCKQGGQ